MNGIFTEHTTSMNSYIHVGGEAACSRSLLAEAACSRPLLAEETSFTVFASRDSAERLLLYILQSTLVPKVVLTQVLPTTHA